MVCCSILARGCVHQLIGRTADTGQPKCDSWADAAPCNPDRAMTLLERSPRLVLLLPKAQMIFVCRSPKSRRPKNKNRQWRRLRFHVGFGGQRQVPLTTSARVPHPCCTTYTRHFTVKTSGHAIHHATCELQSARISAEAIKSMACFQEM